jgi:nucleotide-binding universal stress UspA family protein
VNVRRVVAGVSGSAGSLQALRYATEIARCHDAQLMPILAWTPPGGDQADRRYPSPYLRELWVRAARERLQQAVQLAIGGPPGDVDFVMTVARGETGRVLTELAAEPGDVLVIGAGRHGALRRLLACKANRYCVAHCQCPVIAVPPARLADEVHGLHGWAFRHRIHPGDADLLPPAPDSPAGRPEAA